MSDVSFNADPINGPLDKAVMSPTHAFYHNQEQINGGKNNRFAAMSAVGGSMMVLARTEAISSANYRMMSQARYGAEAGVHRAIHFLLNSYAKPGTAGDPRFGTTMSCAVLDLAENSARIIEYTPAMSYRHASSSTLPRRPPATRTPRFSNPVSTSGNASKR